MSDGTFSDGSAQQYAGDGLLVVNGLLMYMHARFYVAFNNSLMVLDRCLKQSYKPN